MTSAATCLPLLRHLCHTSGAIAVQAIQAIRCMGHIITDSAILAKLLPLFSQLVAIEPHPGEFLLINQFAIPIQPRFDQSPFVP